MSISQGEVEKSTVLHDEDVITMDPKENINLAPLDQDALKALQWKCDIHIIPPLFVLFLLAFLDRTNIGNAKIQGLDTSLHMGGNDYNVALLVFFVPYILLEVPSNIIIKNIAPSTWLSAIMTFWG